MEISSWIAHWASSTPQRTALRFDRRVVSYVELEQAVGSVSSWLAENGVSSGDRVAYLGPNCSELLEALFACARLGAIFVPLNNRMPAAELRVFVDATQPRLLIAEQEFGDIALESAGDLATDRVHTFSAGGELASGITQRAPAGTEAAVAAPVLILFTSGTTGRPKGAIFTHQNIAFNALNVITACDLTATDEVLTAVPMFHTGGLFIHTLPGLCAGATVTIHRQFDAGRVLEEIQRQRITLLACVPAMTFQLVAHPEWKEADLSSLRYVYTGSTVVPRKAIAPWHAKAVHIVQGYGSTEACPTATTTPPGSPPAAALTAGKPTLYTEMCIIDEAGCEVPAGRTGEVCFRGPAVTPGYWENEQATREAFRDGWFRNGDLGLLDQDGYLHIVGRIKDIIIVGSSNVHPTDLEAVLDGCAEITEAAVVGRPDDELGEVPVAFVVRTPGSTLTRQQVRALFDARLADYKLPREVIFLNQLPRNWHGKIDRARLRGLAAQAQQRPHTTEVPTTLTPTAPA